MCSLFLQIMHIFLYLLCGIADSNAVYYRFYRYE